MRRFHWGVIEPSVLAACREANQQVQKPSRLNNGAFFVVFRLPLAIALACAFAAAAPAARRGQLTPSPSAINFGNVPVGGSGVSQVVALTNSGRATLNVSQASVTGTGFSISGLTLPMALVPGQSVNFNVWFNPNAAGNASGYVSLTSDGGNSPTLIALLGSGLTLSPQLTATPSSLGFGSVNLGSSSSLAVNVSNPGTADLVITAANATGSGFSTPSLTQALDVPPGQSSNITVQFTPTSAGGVIGTLLLMSNAGGSPTTISLTGNGVATTPGLGVNPASVAFGNTNVGSSGLQSITLTNTGNANLTITQANVTGSSFSKSGLTLPLTLTPNQSSGFTAAFAPTATGTVSGSISLVSNAPTAPTVINLSGTGVAPGISIGPTSLAFGDVLVGGSSSLILTIQNSGSANLTITAANFAGSNFFFTLTGPSLPLTLTPNQSSNFSVQFAPTAAGGANGNLSIVSNAVTTPTVAVPLSGNGLASAPGISVSPTGLAFGSTGMGSTSTLSLTITNTGNADLTISAANFAGSSCFSASGLSLPLTIPPTQSTNIIVQFAPTSVGSVTGNLAVVSNTATSPMNVPLSAAGSQGHSVTLSWDPSASTVSGYNVYRGMQSGGPYTKLNSSLVLGSTFIDNPVLAAQTYFYVATAIDSNNVESLLSNEISVTIPTP